MVVTVRHGAASSLREDIRLERTVLGRALEQLFRFGVCQQLRVRVELLWLLT